MGWIERRVDEGGVWSLEKFRTVKTKDEEEG